MRQKLTVITLGVRDLDRATRFYEGLGWKRSAASQGDLVLFPLGGMVLALYPRHLLAQDANLPDQPTGFPAITLAYNARTQEEVDQVLAQAQTLGATIVKPAQKASWGGYSGYFQDPDGHLIEVAHNPFWKMDEEGELELP